LTDSALTLALLDDARAELRDELTARSPLG
jgi:hypothetical protein